MLSIDQNLMDVLTQYARDIMRKKRLMLSHASLTPVEQRFLRISDIVEQSLTKARKQGLHPDEPLDGDDWQTETDELLDLSRTFSHSAAFTDLIEQATAQTLDRMAHDAKLRGRLREWKSLPKRLRPQTLQHISNLFLQSAGDIITLEIRKPSVRLDATPQKNFKNGKTCLIYGTYSPAYIGGGHTIAINRHSDTPFKDILHTTYVTMHEAVHATEDALGWMTPSYATLKQTFGHDANLWKAKKDFFATIPSRLYAPYRAQYHEELAHNLEAPVKNGLRAIL